MKRIFLLILFAYFFTAGLIAQSTEIKELTRVKEELVVRRDVLNDSIKSIDKSIGILTAQSEVEIEENEYIVTTIKSASAKIKDEPNIFGNTLYTPNQGDTIYLYDYFEDGYWSCRIDSMVGYLSELYLTKTNELEALKNDVEYQGWIKKYGSSMANKIRNHRLAIGMSQEMVRLSIGNPDDINKSVYSSGVHEQWVYERRDLYVYFENYKVTSWQD